MSDKLVPANPAEVMVIRDLTPNITTLSLPFLRVGLFEVGGRCTIVRLTGGGVLVFSPVALTADAAAVVTRLGGKEGVRYIVAPDMEHHIFLSEWLKAYPNARIVAPQGLAEKRAATKGKDPRVNVDDAFFAVLQDKRKQPMSEAQSVAPDFDADFGLVYMDMHPSKEIVLFYRPDNVLIQADLMFNLPANEQYQRVDPATRRNTNVLNRFFQAIMRTQGDIKWTRRFLWYFASSSDRVRFNEGIRVIDSWPFETIVPCHGETITKDAKTIFRRVFEWHLENKKN
ncbi:uncharacterized protein SPSK_03561 [Sporothrix schenckii 1099-18]|uniref:Metallo-beta-lactamase domain-containing protein n=2 Tax=Sporothrix schenckii TaxID=29908 RepID=U7PV42_SPOS1|nr:uncharacterized protein SPSK_03561 [Sporothrix schenckii 1099-18]ERS99498.1 hypothetical protein HMPREF1624_04699 [Sporothrix schenckii ATCC 58251]KJR82770.1 hypothetical protein SPSK_03561 [Sporothrix schenckii 1099-18]